MKRVVFAFRSTALLALIMVVATSVVAHAGPITAGEYLFLDHPDAYLFKTDNPCCDDPITGDPGPMGCGLTRLTRPTGGARPTACP